eukprot:jgi/Ulvmu1/4408/UM002_0133.1
MGNHQSRPRGYKPVIPTLHHPSQLSIIIPALNEQSCISQAIRSTNIQGTTTQPEVIVVDGGSKDCTRSIAGTHTGVRVLCVPEGGRGVQLNAGAAQTSKDWLLFMHADCQLPKGYFESMKSALVARQAIKRTSEWGCFCTIETGVPSMKLVQWGVRMRTWLRGQPYGDQGLFCCAQTFQGTKFKEWPFLEDFQWVTVMNRVHGRPAIAEVPLLASPRRWMHYGVLQTTCLNQIVLTGYSIGVPVHTLHWFYNSARNFYTSK